MRCYRCDGTVRDEKVRYTLTVVDQLVFVEGVPAHVCQQCGEQTFDLDVVKQLEVIRDLVMQGDLRPAQRPVGNLTFAYSLA